MKKNEFFWLLILGSFGYYYYDVISSGRLGLYLHPKMFGYAYFALAVFILFFIVQFLRLLIVTDERPFNKGYLIFLIPVAVVVLLNPRTLSVNAVTMSGNEDLLGSKTSLCPVENSRYCGVGEASYSVEDLAAHMEAETTVSEMAEALTEETVTEKTAKETVISETAVSESTASASTEVETTTVLATTVQTTQAPAESVQAVETTTAPVTEALTEPVTEAVTEPIIEEPTAATAPEMAVVPVTESEPAAQPATEGAASQAPAGGGNLNSFLAGQGYPTESEQYMEIIRLAYEEVDSLEGMDVTIQGFVLKQDNFAATQFYVGRMVITCCASCAQAEGFLCELDAPQDIPNHQWVKVSGTFHKGTYASLYDGDIMTLPMLDISTIEYIEEPLDPYVYFVWN